MGKTHRNNFEEPKYHGRNHNNAPAIKRNRKEKRIQNALRSNDPSMWIDDDNEFEYPDQENPE